MDGDAGPHVAVYDGFSRGSPPVYQYQFLPGKGCEGIYGAKHASLSGMWNLNFDISRPSNSEQILNDGPDSSAARNSTDWDGFSFLARPNAESRCNAREFVMDRDIGSVEQIKPSDLRLNACHDWSSGAVADPHLLKDLARTEQKRKQSLFNTNGSPAHELISVNDEDGVHEDAARLSLKLCSGSYSCLEDTEDGLHNHKRYRSSSPGNQSSTCQVDDCHADLKHAKDYHRRHKVCEVHSKAAESRVHGLMQRFCQQCSRFHPLPEFDEGKRSCRRRLAGHNRRRRKPHPVVGSSGVDLSDAVKGSELLSIFAILSQLQLAKAREKLDVPRKEQESTLLGLKESSLLLPIAAALIRDATTGACASNATCQPPQISPGVQGSGQEGLFNALASLPPEQLSLMLQSVLLARGSSTPGRVPQPEVSRQLQSSNQNIRPQFFPSLGSSEKLPSTSGGNMESNIQCIPFRTEKSGRLKAGFDLSERPSKTTVTRQYIGAASPCFVERSSGSVPPAEKNLFPTYTGSGFGNGIASRTDNGNFNAELKKKNVSEKYSDIWTSTPRTHRALASDVPSQQRSEASESESDQSPSSSASDWQELSGRIMFKLFDKTDLGDFPQDLCGQIQRWLTHIPSSMEAYMRPGCILLTVFLAMPYNHWKELLTNFRESLERLLTDAQCDFWRKGRIVVQGKLHRALIIDGKIRRIKCLRSSNGPSLKSVRPLAVVAGEETTLVVRGHNFAPQTKILCVYHGKYVLHEVPWMGMRALDTDSNTRVLERENVQQVQRVHFPGGPANVLGRCYIEVENDLLGNILPVIVADKSICMELHSLEKELDLASPTLLRQRDECPTNELYVDKELEAISFLHELGWLFQRSYQSRTLEPCLDVAPVSLFKLSRFKALLRYAVLHDWCALMKKLLDLLFDIAKENNGSYQEAEQILAEVKLVHQAVKRKCRGMVELLLQYIPCGDESSCQRVFTPVMEGPAGLTPLHIAASISNAGDIIDALTNDPFEVGLHAWTGVCDDSGHTPQWHALNSGNFPYAQLVDEKLKNRQSLCVRIKISDVPQETTPNIKGMDVIAARNGDAVDMESMLAELAKFSKKPTTHAHTCGNCKRASSVQHHSGTFGTHSSMYRPLMMMMVAVATLCAAVSLLFKGPPHLDFIGFSLKWERIMYGSL